MSPLLVLLTKIGYLHYFGIKIPKITRWYCTANKNTGMNEIFLKSPNVCSLALRLNSQRGVQSDDQGIVGIAPPSPGNKADPHPLS